MVHRAIQPLTRGVFAQPMFWGCLSAQPDDNFCRMSALPHLLKNYHQLWPLIPSLFLLGQKMPPKLYRILADRDIFSGTFSPGNRVQLVLCWQRRGDNLGPVTDTDPLFMEVSALLPWRTLDLIICAAFRCCLVTHWDCACCVHFKQTLCCVALQKALCNLQEKLASKLSKLVVTFYLLMKLAAIST